METERESITQMRVRMYREALAQQREENELAEREAEKAKEAEAETGKEPEAPGSGPAHAAAHESNDKG
jgi:hypothetical protein